MIHALLIINNHGKARLTKFYKYFVCGYSVLPVATMAWLLFNM